MPNTTTMSNIKISILLLTLFTAIYSPPGFSGNANSIMQEFDLRQRMISNGSLTKSVLSSCKFTVKNGNVSCVDTPRVKILESASKQYGHNLLDRRSISILLEPASERGIGMLTYSYGESEKSTESWLYLSALGKVKRMAAGSNGNEDVVSIFGSEFTTEDTESGKTDEYNYKVLQEGMYGENEVWVIEATPKPSKYQNSEYSKLIYWIDKDKFISIKAHAYDKKGKLLKKILSKDSEKIDSFWITRDVTVINVQSKRLSNMLTESITVNANIDDEFLTERTLTDFAFREKHLKNLRSQFQ